MTTDSTDFRIEIRHLHYAISCIHLGNLFSQEAKARQAQFSILPHARHSYEDREKSAASDDRAAPRSACGLIVLDNPVWEICERVAEVQALLDDHLAGGKHSAAASRYHAKAPDEIDWSLPERQTRAVAEFLGALDDEDPDADRKVPLP
jgi:hypothetical protein